MLNGSLDGEPYKIIRSAEKKDITMYSRVNSLGIFGLDGYPVVVEADTSQGLPMFDIVGLPDAAVSESRNRVRAAIKNSRFIFPVSRITVNLAPADKRKSGPLYDLPVMLALLLSSYQIDFDIEGRAFVGELSLEGGLRPVNGALPMAIAAKESGMRELYLPKENAPEASVVEGLAVFGVDSVTELISHLSGGAEIGRQPPVRFEQMSRDYGLDFSDVKGQFAPRRALEIAAAGGHNLIMIGAPGSGKSMLAKRIPSIMPPISYNESIETTRIYSVAGVLPAGQPLITARPFRSPHHTVSSAGLSGGGSIPKPGEISLAHNGVLFLDELPEFSRSSMEALRQPVEDDVVTISRAAASLSYPCSIMLVAAMNPCPCGNFGSETKTCTCSGGVVERYLARISGPLLDRIDLHVEVLPVDYSAISDDVKGEASELVRARVLAARKVQELRFEGLGFNVNAKIPAAKMREFCAMTRDARATLKLAFERLGLSARAYDKVLKTSRTIADLAGDDIIDRAHVAEAVQYRALDKKYWTR